MKKTLVFPLFICFLFCAAQEAASAGKIDVKPLAVKSRAFVEENRKNLDRMVKAKENPRKYKETIERPALRLLSEWPTLNEYADRAYFRCFLYLDTFRLYSEHYFNAGGKPPKPDQPVYEDLAEQMQEQKGECDELLNQ